MYTNIGTDECMLYTCIISASMLLQMMKPVLLKKLYERMFGFLGYCVWPYVLFDSSEVVYPHVKKEVPG